MTIQNDVPHNICAAPENNTLLNRAQLLNQDCFCVSLDEEALRLALRDNLSTNLSNNLNNTVGDDSLFQLIQERCPHIFSQHPIFISPQHVQRIQIVISAIEEVIHTPAFQSHVLASAPSIAQHPDRNISHAQGVFFGYDFHVSEDEFGVIEINTNAGGALLNSALGKAQRACCEAVKIDLPPQKNAENFEDAILKMFQNEWTLSGNTKPLKTIAIIDDNPEDQYLYPEFLLFQRLFQTQGIQALIADPSELSIINDKLMCQGIQVDLIYNRLTDFYFEETKNAVLHDAYLRNIAVITPHPQAHALYADKHHLALLSDEQFLTKLNIEPNTQAILINNIPHTELITKDNAERLWANRRHLFFKPTKGFGSRAAYRGDKITTKVWAEVLKNDYVAQHIVPPGERGTSAQLDAKKLKFDLRAYTYQGKIQWLAARLYQGQTTNFRTMGGGFAVVYESGQITANS